MSYDALWPGDHVLIYGTVQDAIQARREGLQLRDTFAVFSPDAVHHVFLFRKALEGTSVQNLIKHGTGVLDIDGCRVSTINFDYEGSDSFQSKTFSNRDKDGEQVAASGRWPTNVVLVHSQKCEHVGVKKIPGHKGYPNGPGGKSYQYSSAKRGVEVRPEPWQGHADEEGQETIDDWKCVTTCPIRLLNEQSGERPSTLTGRADPATGYENPSLVKKPGIFNVAGMGYVYADSGGAARFYVQVLDGQVDEWFHKLTKVPQ